MADEIVVYDGEKPNVIARFDAGVSGKSVLSLTQLKAGRTGTVERSADGRTITEESQNLSAGNYRFIAAPGEAESTEVLEYSSDYFLLLVFILGG